MLEESIYIGYLQEISCMGYINSMDYFQSNWKRIEAVLHCMLVCENMKEYSRFLVIRVFIIKLEFSVFILFGIDCFKGVVLVLASLVRMMAMVSKRLVYYKVIIKLDGFISFYKYYFF
jgi:hypothetical protein